MRFILYFLCFVFFFDIDTKAQQESNGVKGVTVIVPAKEKTKTSYFSFSGGYQIPTLVNVPMLPENSPNLVKESNMEVIIPGWFAQWAINKKTKSNFDIGLQTAYYKNSVPVALAGQRSTSDWVLEKTDNLFTEIYNEDIIRTSETVSVRAIVKYKYQVQNINLWLGIAGGSFSTVIDYSYSSGSRANETYRQTDLGVSYLTGIDLLKRNKDGRDIVGISIFGDISGPSINEFFISLFESGWSYDNIPGNHSINPIRLGLCLNIY